MKDGSPVSITPHVDFVSLTFLAMTLKIIQRFFVSPAHGSAARKKAVPHGVAVPCSRRGCRTARIDVILACARIALRLIVDLQILQFFWG